MDLEKTMTDLELEHAALRREIGNARQFVDRRGPVENPLAHRNAVLGMLSRLQHRLSSHFRGEEHGIYANVQHEFPTADRALDLFRAEHIEILEALERVRHLVRRTSKTGPSEQQALGVWLDTLLDHEDRETEFLSDLLVRDVGTKD